MNHGFFRVATFSPDMVVADCEGNGKKIITAVEQAWLKGASLVVFPELCISGSTCGNLFYQSALINSSLKAVIDIAENTARYSILICVGLPFIYENNLYDCCAVMQRGKIIAIIPKNYDTQKFFTTYPLEAPNKRIQIPGLPETVVFGSQIIFQDPQQPEAKIAIEIGTDFSALISPATKACEAGATIICNLSSLNEMAERQSYRRMMVTSQSMRLSCGYVLADASLSESTTDFIFSGHNIIAEKGRILTESNLYGDGFLAYDIDVENIVATRVQKNFFGKYGTGTNQNSWENILLDFCRRNGDLRRVINKLPFVPKNPARLSKRCNDIFAMQSHALAKRLKHINCKNAVIGLSGGLDSTLAFLVTVEAFKLLELDLSGIHAITMPCFGTTNRTYNNACNLAKVFGTTLSEINIEKAVLQHFQDIGHDVENHDVTYENSQARERTQVLMDVANQLNGLVIGTGDLSELALGWATYNGDHMSMYGVNASVPKTLMRHLVSWFADNCAEASMTDAVSVLKDILDTPVSPELLPAKDGLISQKTEEIVGPYELHDFFLFHFVRNGFEPKKILFLAQKAFDGEYDKDTIKKWLTTFCKRFFSQQFKRSCLPDGVALGSVSLSPRGSWSMPSDASCESWLYNL